MPNLIFKTLLPALLVCLIAPLAVADEVVIQKGEKQLTLAGKILVEAQDESILFQTRVGELLILTADQIKSKTESIEVVEALSKEKIGEQLLKELPAGFKIRISKHYVIAYQNEDAYAKWIEDLYEDRLFKEFQKFAKKKLKMELSEPEFPLVAIVFASKPEFARHVRRTLGDEASVDDMIAYYNQMTNRVVMYDLTFDLHGGDLDDRRIKEILSRRAAIPMVATIIHEATHQLMHNRGLQTRMADRPLWINEGLAIYFEAPDLDNRKGWHHPGLVHYDRLIAFRDYLRTQRQPGSIESLVATDIRFHGETSLNAYAEAWALVHFLMRKYPKQMASYLKATASMPRCKTIDGPARLTEFKKHFGDDLQKLDQQFLKYISRLK